MRRKEQFMSVCATLAKLKRICHFLSALLSRALNLLAGTVWTNRPLVPWPARRIQSCGALHESIRSSGRREGESDRSWAGI